MLFWHKHNLDKSLTDLANFTPFPGKYIVRVLAMTVNFLSMGFSYFLHFLGLF